MTPGELHTKTTFERVTIDEHPAWTLVLGPVNRRRRVRLTIENDANVQALLIGVSIAFAAKTSKGLILGTGGGNIKGLCVGIEHEFYLGPNERLYGQWSENYDFAEKVFNLSIEDSVNEGYATDVGSDVAGAQSGGGVYPAQPLTAVAARAVRSALVP